MDRQVFRTRQQIRRTDIAADPAVASTGAALTPPGIAVAPGLGTNNSADPGDGNCQKYQNRLRPPFHNNIGLTDRTDGSNPCKASAVAEPNGFGHTDSIQSTRLVVITSARERAGAY